MLPIILFMILFAVVIGRPINIFHLSLYCLIKCSFVFASAQNTSGNPSLNSGFTKISNKLIINFKLFLCLRIPNFVVRKHTLAFIDFRCVITLQLESSYIPRYLYFWRIGYSSIVDSSIFFAVLKATIALFFLLINMLFPFIHYSVSDNAFLIYGKSPTKAISSA